MIIVTALGLRIRACCIIDNVNSRFDQCKDYIEYVWHVQVRYSNLILLPAANCTTNHLTLLLETHTEIHTNLLSLSGPLWISFV